jgi:hypothetical protein
VTGPSLLVAYPQLAGFLRARADVAHRSWVLDSGAYSALTSGLKIDLSRYIDECLSLLAGPRPPEVIFGLDVIGDPEASARNVERMIAAGVPAVPTFHHGSPWHYLDGLARQHERIAFGGLVARGAGGHGTRLQIGDKLRFIEGCVSRSWPRWAHGFGCADRRILGRYPLASADSTTWYYGPARYGDSSLIGKQRGPRTGHPAFPAFVDLEVSTYLRMERDVAGRWARVMSGAGLPRFTLRLATSAKDCRSLSPARVASILASL